MATKTENEKLEVLENLLIDARAEADTLRAKLARYEQIIDSTRLIMGHELKKPTTAISGYLELVCEDLELNNELATLTLAEKARAECDLLNELNAFYLELLKVDNDDKTVGHCSIDVGDLVHDIIAEFPGKCRAHERVRVNVSEHVQPIRFNKDALKLIIMNLVENALLYSQASTPVQIDVGCGPDRRGMLDRDLLKIKVNDSGIGIPEQSLKKIFSPFVRLREDMAEGSGLGLTLVRSLVELNGGEISIRSAKGEGTTVHVTIPTSPERQVGPGDDV